jgi:hypothetical protein
MTSTALSLSLFALVMSLVSAVAVTVVALAYLRRVRMERPAVGTFNRRDVVTLFVLLAALPLLYVRLPRVALTAVLAITFVSALSIGLRPLLRPAALWLTVGVLIGADIWTGNNLLGTVHGWQAYWLENSLIVLLAAVSVANLYVQGGMKLQHVAWFAAALSIYDVFFTSFFPITNALVESFLGFPLDPSVGMRWGFDNAAVGLGDLLVYALFVTAALKAYGRTAARLAVALVVVFGAAVPSLVPLVIDYVDARTDTLVPAQAWFGPAALVGFSWMRRRYGRERTTAEFLASADVLAARRTRPERPAPVLAPPSQPAPATPARAPAAQPVG